MSIYCKTCDHTYFKEYYPTHIKTALHLSKTFLRKPLMKEDYTCNECDRTHSNKEIEVINEGKYKFFEGCYNCLYELRVLKHRKKIGLKHKV